MGQPITVAREHCLRLPRHGNTWEEYEDACACNLAAGRFAIADGASESIFAGEWARALCDSFVAASAAIEEVTPWVATARQRWQTQFAQPSTVWHQEEKLRDGAHATFLGVTIATNATESSWHAIAVGDTCLFQIRNRSLMFAFPVDSAGDFNTRPDLLGTNQEGRIRVAAARGSLVPGDRLLLMTDALATWFLTRYEKRRKPWDEIGELTETTFAEWIESQRKARKLKNDDVTLLRIDLGVTNA